MTLLVIMLAFLLVFPKVHYWAPYFLTFLSDLCNFADDNSLCTSSKLLCHLISILKQDIVDILFWFKINQMVANPAKFQVMFMGTKEAAENFVIKDILIPVTDLVKPLGIIIDKKLNFKCHTEKGHK